MTATTTTGSAARPGLARRDAADLALAAAMLLMLGVTAILFRPPLPVDETRYLSVAWDMARAGNLLVPHLDGQGYTHKPPLLFWAIRLVWAVAGVSETAARLVPVGFTAGLLWATHALGRRLWPDRPGVASLALPLLVGMGPVTLFATMVMFDVPVALGVTIALIGLHDLARRGRPRDMVVAGLGLGIGLLAKGPVAAVFVLPALIAAPLWAGRVPPGGWTRFALQGLGAVAIGIAMILGWALPAALAGGPEFARMLLWGQTAGRVVQAFDHARPWWFYPAILPAMLLPFLVVPAFWLRLRDSLSGRPDAGSRFCLVVAGGAFLVMSFVSAKQIHYLLPALGPVALLLARMADGAPMPPLSRRLRRIWLLPAALVAVAGIVAALPPLVGRLPGMSGTFIAWGPLVVALVMGFLVVAAAIHASPDLDPAAAFKRAALAWVAVLVMLNLYGGSGLFRAFDIRPAGREVARLVAADGGPVVFVGGSHDGLLDFQGRLTAPVAEFPAGADITRWASDNPGGIIAGRIDARGAPGWTPVYVQPFRGRRMAVWRVADRPQ